MWQLAVYSLIGVFALVVVAVFMFAALDELGFLDGSEHRYCDQVDEDVVLHLLAATAGIFFLLTVFLPHWATGLDTFGGWLQAPLNPD